LRPGERVVVSNTALLRNAMPVRLAGAASGMESSSPSSN
jgi:hypothetical protein